MHVTYMCAWDPNIFTLIKLYKTPPFFSISLVTQQNMSQGCASYQNISLHVVYVIKHNILYLPTYCIIQHVISFNLSYYSTYHIMFVRVSNGLSYRVPHSRWNAELFLRSRRCCNPRKISLFAFVSLSLYLTLRNRRLNGQSGYGSAV